MNKIQKVPNEVQNKEKITDTFFSGKIRPEIAGFVLTLTALSAANFFSENEISNNTNEIEQKIINANEITSNNTYANVGLVCLNDEPYNINNFIINDTGKIGINFNKNSMKPIVGWGVEKNQSLQDSLDLLCKGKIKKANESLHIKINNDMSAIVTININEVNKAYSIDEASKISDTNMVEDVDENYQMRNPNITDEELAIKMIDIMIDHSDKFEKRMASMPDNTKFEMIFSQYINDVEAFNSKILNDIDLKNDSEELVIKKMNANFGINEDKNDIEDYLYMSAKRKKEKTELTQKEKEIINTEFEMPNFGEDDKVVKNTSSTQKIKI